MNAENRIFLCRLIEKMGKEKSFCDRAGLINTSALTEVHTSEAGEGIGVGFINIPEYMSERR